MMPQRSVFGFLLLLSVAAGVANSGYVLDWEAQGDNFFDKFNFMTNNDYSHGFVNYVNYTTAVARNLTFVNSNKQVVLQTDTTNVVAEGARGRDSVRIESKKLFNKGLFLADVEHMPTGCGTWPAWWTYSPMGWPTFGEIDIIEGVHTSTVDASTLHTSTGCAIQNVDVASVMTGNYTTPNCSSSSGCGVQVKSNSYGAPFNAGQGGVYAMEWTSSFIRVWFFNRSSIPSDVSAGTPNPTGWSMPFAYFPLGTNCPETHFANHTIVINLTFCGDWAGPVWSQFASCSAQAANCTTFVRNNPSAFKEAYWQFNYVRTYTYQQDASAGVKPVAWLSDLI